MISVWLKHMMIERAMDSVLDHADRMFSEIPDEWPSDGSTDEKFDWLERHGYFMRNFPTRSLPKDYELSKENKVMLGWMAWRRELREVSSSRELRESGSTA